MAKVEDFYEKLGRLLSRSQIRELGKALDAAGVNIMPEAFAGLFFVVTVLSSLLVALLALQVEFPLGILYGVGNLLLPQVMLSANRIFLLLTLSLVLSFLTVTIVFFVIVYVVLMLRSDARKKAVEEVLPDFLMLAAANVRAGMTVDQALWYAAKPEFGLLSAEVELVARRTFGGEPFNKSLDKLSDRFNSKSVRRAVALIKQGLASGGQMADILERTAIDARNGQLIRKEISASLLMYVIFIIFAVCFGTPFLFAVSRKLIIILEGVFAQLPAAGEMPQVGFIHPSPPSISSDDFFYFTLVSFFITSIFASLIVGVVQKAEKKEGVKYIPLFLVLTFIIYFIVTSLLNTFLATMG